VAAVFFVLLLLVVFFITMTQFLIANPEYWVTVIIVVGIIVFGSWYLRDYFRDKRVKASKNMGLNLAKLASDFPRLTNLYLNLRPDEIAFYELEGVELREFRSSGSDFKSDYFGGNIALSKGLSISLGSSTGKLDRRPEESTTIDVGKATFTTQRVIFTGPNHTREWEFKNLVGLDIGIAGFYVTPAVSNRSKASSLAGDSVRGITPGILFAIAVEYFQNGEEAAKAFAKEHADDILEQVDEYYATGKVRKFK
jgi:hypothetical protein